MQEEIRSYEELRERLVFFADDDYREFAMKGIFTERPLLGVRSPQMQEIVKMIPRELYEDFIKIEPVAFEEVLVRGMLICKLPYAEMLKWFDSQVDYIGDWATCDTFCSGLTKMVRKNREEFFELKIEKSLEDSREFAVRVGVVMLKCAYVEFDYLAVIFDRMEKLCEREEYYIRMGTAWTLAECFVKFPDETLAYMKVSKLPKWTYNKTISKICDSYRVDEDMKNVVRGMRKK